MNTRPPDQVEVVNAFIAAINRHDVPALSKLMTEGHTFVDSRGEKVSGRAVMTAGWTGYFGMFPDYRIQVDSIAQGGDFVAVFGSAAGTYNGKRGLVTANRIEMPAAWKAVVEDGQIAYWQVYADWTEGCRIMEEDRRQG